MGEWSFAYLEYLMSCLVFNLSIIKRLKIVVQNDEKQFMIQCILNRFAKISYPKLHLYLILKNVKSSPYRQHLTLVDIYALLMDMIRQ
ncbi:hypothetical protein ZOSMA_178G00320 [Zostera marina]|uniref:Uncharacterized protein n=1 Tax=Zostera marina TaxID=29655 RepID=A0A0K9PRS9_ZOSMR|nr:hypothetical protein ZOSMA_178G00320 [Zostera marina]